jgi:hypothetical protein
MGNSALSSAGITPAVQLAVLAAIVVLLLGAAAWIALLKRRNPREREKRRRLAVNGHGRMGDGLIIDLHEDILYYNYSIRGVDYAASQDVSTLREFLPENPALMVGPVTLKYSSRNPANSILICEEWSGLRRRAQNGLASACRAAAAGAAQ